MLSRLQTLRKPIRVVITGMGAMGKGLLYQCHVTPGLECVGIADINVEKASDCLKELGLTYRVIDSLVGVQDAIRNGIIPVCEDGEILSKMEDADALIESSSAIEKAGRFALSAIESGKHLILMNAEIDLIFGPYLMRRAHDLGVVYTSCDGDQHSVIKRIIDHLRLWGFELVMGGNIKGFLDRYSNPTKIVPEADKRHQDYRMCTAYTDGTKLNIEMALLSNALGMRADKTGMNGPRAKNVNDVFRLFDFDSLWKNREAVVDYVLGAQPDGGVFAIGYCNDSYQQSMLRYYKMGNGPFYLFYRPYHLCHIESMECIAEAVIDGKSLLEPKMGFRTNVFAYAKKDLREGEVLDGIGGYTCYGLIENCPRDSLPEGLPICLTDGVLLKRDVPLDQPILFSDIKFDLNRFDFELYRKALNQPVSRDPYNKTR
jgi:predicted homoserine dehydrogenase-like protein